MDIVFLLISAEQRLVVIIIVILTLFPAKAVIICSPVFRILCATEFFFNFFFPLGFVSYDLQNSDIFKRSIILPVVDRVQLTPYAPYLLFPKMNITHKLFPCF